MRESGTELRHSRSYKTLILIIGQGINALVSFLFFPYLARALSVENYGTYGQVQLITDLAKSFFVMGLTNIVYVQFSHKASNTGTVFKSNLVFSLVSGTIAALCLFIFSGPIGHIFKNQTMIEFIKILSVSLLLQIPADYLSAVLIYFNKIKQNAVILVLTNLFKICLLVISIYYFQSLQMVYYSFIAVSLFQLILSLIFLPWDQLLQGRVDVRIMKSQLSLSLPLVLSGITGYLLKFIDGLIVSSLLNVKDYAVYRNGAFEIPLISIVYSSVSAVTLPELSRLNVQKDIGGIINLKRRVSSAIAIFTVPITVFTLFFSSTVVSLLFGDQYAGSAIVFLIVNLLILIRINDYQDVLIIKSRTGTILLYNIICLLFNIVLSYGLILLFGIAGAAIATTLSIYLFAFLLLRKTTSVLNSPLFSFFEIRILLVVFTVSILISAAAYLCFKIINNDLSIVPLGIMYLVIVYSIFYKLKFMELSIVNDLLVKFNLKRRIA